MEVDLEDGKEIGEGKKWEQEQMSSAVFHFGSKDRPSAQEEYDLIVDQIEFIKALSMPGTKQVSAATETSNLVCGLILTAIFSD